MRNVPTLVLTALLVAAAPRLARADAESDLRAQWQGSFVVTQTPLSSECTDHFTDNTVTAGRVSGASGNGLRFAPGEIANIDKLEVTWTRIDVSLTFLEPFRVTWKDGPYTLYDQRRCRVQLKLEVPRDVRKDTTKANAALAALLERFASEPAARKAASYNRRAVEAYPKDWERIRAEHDVWRAAHVNAEIEERIDGLLREAQDFVDRGNNDDDYLFCFGRGARARAYQSFGSCEYLLSSYFSSNGSCKNQRGYDDGGRLAWSLGMVRALNACFVPAPQSGR